MSALTIIQLILTAIVEIGLGLTAIGISYFIPKINRKSFLYLSLKMGALVVIFSIIGDLITSIGLTSNLFYDFFYATANGQPNGAHISSYLCIGILFIVTYWKTKDVFLSGLMSALLVALHEFIWILFYYATWYKYLVFPEMLTNFLKDFPIFISMLILIIIAFFKYKPNPFNAWNFYWIITWFIFYMFCWTIIPNLINPSYYGFLPIRTANLPSSFSTVTFTQFNETKYFNDFLTNGLEVFSWIFLFIMMSIMVCKKKIH